MESNVKNLELLESFVYQTFNGLSYKEKFLKEKTLETTLRNFFSNIDDTRQFVALFNAKYENIEISYENTFQEILGKIKISEE